MSAIAASGHELLCRAHFLEMCRKEKMLNHFCSLRSGGRTNVDFQPNEPISSDSRFFYQKQKSAQKFDAYSKSIGLAG